MDTCKKNGIVHWSLPVNYVILANCQVFVVGQSLDVVLVKDWYVQPMGAAKKFVKNIFTMVTYSTGKLR